MTKPLREIEIKSEDFYNWITSQPADRELRMYSASGWLSQIDCGCLMVEFVKDYCRDHPEENLPKYIACGWKYATLYDQQEAQSQCSFFFRGIPDYFIRYIMSMDSSLRPARLTFGNVQKSLDTLIKGTTTP